MKISKSLVSAGVLTAVAVGSLAGVGAVNAFDTNQQDGLIDRIATDTGVDRAKIAASFDAYHEEMHAKIEEKRSAHLQELVDNGTITAEQKTAIEAKHDEMETQRESWKDQNLTRAEMRDKMEAARQEFETWADEQGIDLEVLRLEGMGGHGFRHGGPGMHGTNESDANNTDDSEAQSQ